MPRIPTFETQAQPTTEVGSVKSSIQLPINAPFAGIQSALTEYYINEKKKEAVVKTLDYKTKYWSDDENGNAGLFSIKDRHANNPNVTEATQGYLNDVRSKEQQLMSSLEGESTFLKQSVISEFKADAQRTLLTVEQGARNALEKKEAGLWGNIVSIEGANVADNLESLTLSKESLKNKSEDLFKGREIDRQIALEKGFSTLEKFYADRLFEKDKARLFNELKSGQLTNLDINEREKFLKESSKGIAEDRSRYLSSGLEPVVGKTTALDVQNAYDQANNGKFGGDLQKIKTYNALSPDEKTKFKEDLKKIKNESIAFINNANTAIMNQRKQESTNNSIRVYDDYRTNGIVDQLKVKEVFGDVKDNKIAADTRQQFIDISIKQANGELKKISNYYKNGEITNKILSGEITDLSTPFVLKGEDEAKSILQRAGDGVNPDVDLQFYVKYLLPNVKDEQFLNDNKRFFEFISKYERAVEGPKYASLLDINSDNRLNAFKNDMLEKFISQRKAGTSTEDLLNPTSKKFIGNNIANYMVNLNEVSKAIDNQYKPLEGKPLRVKGEKPEDYLKRIGK